MIKTKLSRPTTQKDNWSNPAKLPTSLQVRCPDCDTITSVQRHSLSNLFSALRCGLYRTQCPCGETINHNVVYQFEHHKLTRSTQTYTGENKNDNS